MLSGAWRPTRHNNRLQHPLVMLPLSGVAEILVKHQGLHEGLYDLSIQFQMAFGGVGPHPDLIFPGAMLGVSGIGLTRIDKISAHTVDASKVNPAKQTRKKKD